MAIQLTKKTDSKSLLKIISVTDSAIDWDASYAEPGDLEDDTPTAKQDDLPEVSEENSLSLEDQKKRRYSRDHDTTKLKFKQDDLPTQFVFNHPHRVDVARKIREISGQIYAAQSAGKNAKADKDMFTLVFHNFYMGLEQGFGNQREAAPRINGRVTDEYLQTLEDAEVFMELNRAFMTVYNEDRSKDKAVKAGK